MSLLSFTNIKLVTMVNAVVSSTLLNNYRKPCACFASRSLLASSFERYHLDSRRGISSNNSSRENQHNSLVKNVWGKKTSNHSQRNTHRSKYVTSYCHHTAMGKSSLVSSTIRLFGTKRGSDGDVGTSGAISIYDEQSTLPDLDLKKLEQTISYLSQILGYETYDVSLILCEDEEMQEVNKDSRDIDAPTDILSFPFSDSIIEPGILEDPPFDIPDYYNLGDMIIDIPYVIRRCEEDRLQNEEQDSLEEERGISGAMANIYDAEKRIHMLLIHGMLHLVGYDHIEDDDYELMVTEEEAVLKKLNQLMEERENNKAIS